MSGVETIKLERFKCQTCGSIYDRKDAAEACDKYMNRDSEKGEE